eukprot:5549207-Amphidinium_carterae.2
MAFTTVVVEQAHASATLMRRQHFMYQKEILCCRAFMHTLRTLFTPDEAETRMTKLTHRADRIKNKQPQKINGKALFMRDLFAAARASAPPGFVATKLQRQAMFAEVGSRFLSLSLGERLRYEEAAHHEQQVSLERLEQELAHVRAEQVLHEQRLAQTLQVRGLLMRLSSARFTPDEFKIMEARVNSSDFKGQRLENFRLASMLSPQLPSSHTLAELDLHSPTQQRVLPKPPWLRDVCSIRTHTHGAVLRLVFDDKTFYYWILFASLSLYKLVCKPLQITTGHSMFSQRCTSLQEWVNVTSDLPIFQFKLMPGTHVDPHIHMDGEPVVHILLDACLSKCNHVCSWCSWVSLQEIMDEAETKQRATTENTQPRPKKPKINDFTDEELQMYPWLRDVVAPQQIEQEGASSSATNRRIPQDYDEDRLQLALDEFKRKKQEWDMHYTQDENFLMTVKGGRWAQAVLNRSFHLVEAKARTEHVAEWCQAHGLHRLASFTFTKYAEHGASLLAQLWCHRLSFYFGLYAGDGKMDAASIREAIDAYKEPSAADLLQRHCGSMASVKKRLEEIRALRPS